LKWGGDEEERQDACGISEPTGTVGLSQYLPDLPGTPVCDAQDYAGPGCAAAGTLAPQAALYQALLPFGNSR